MVVKADLVVVQSVPGLLLLLLFFRGCYEEQGSNLGNFCPRVAVNTLLEPHRGVFYGTK